MCTLGHETHCKTCTQRIESYKEQLAEMKANADAATVRESELWVRIAMFKRAFHKLTEECALPWKIQNELESLMEDDFQPLDDAFSCCESESFIADSVGGDANIGMPIIPKLFAWDYPLSRSDKLVRVHQLFKNEIKEMEMVHQMFRNEIQEMEFHMKKLTRTCKMPLTAAQNRSQSIEVSKRERKTIHTKKEKPSCLGNVHNLDTCTARPNDKPQFNGSHEPVPMLNDEPVYKNNLKAFWALVLPCMPSSYPCTPWNWKCPAVPALGRLVSSSAHRYEEIGMCANSKHVTDTFRAIWLKRPGSTSTYRTMSLSSCAKLHQLAQLTLCCADRNLM